jgi:MPBQ/MSBQ methyltransferase
MSELRDEARRHLHEQYAGTFSPQAIERHLEDHVGETLALELVALLQTRRPDAARILDVGCGYGSFVLAARDVGIDATGIDVASFEIGWARRRLRERRPADDPDSVYLIGASDRLPFPDDSFDAVCFWNVLEHLRDIGGAIVEAARVLHSGGSLFAIAPNYASFRREAHYHVPWAPLLPSRVAIPYLRALGRDPAFFRDEVYPITKWGALRAVRAAGLILRDPRSERVAHPETANRAWVRRALRWAQRLKLAGPAAFAVHAQLVNPLSPTITLEAMKP